MCKNHSNLKRIRAELLSKNRVEIDEESPMKIVNANFKMDKYFSTSLSIFHKFNLSSTDSVEI